MIYLAESKKYGVAFTHEFEMGSFDDAMALCDLMDWFLLGELPEMVFQLELDEQVVH